MLSAQSFITIILFIPSLLLIPPPVFAEEPISDLLIIGTKVAPPFAMKDTNGEWEGISIELWQRIATELNLEYQWQELDLQSLLESVESSGIDVAIAAITISAERESHFDFSHAYYATGLSIAIPTQTDSAWKQVVKGLFSKQILLIVSLLILVLCAIGTITWLAERRKNPDKFNPDPIKGIASGIWWAAVTMTTVGYGDMTPRTLWGRVIAVFWMFASLLLVSVVIGGVASTLTLAKMEPLVSGPEDLPKVRIASIENSISADYLKERKLKADYYSSVYEGLKAVDNHKVDVMVYDEPLLKYTINQSFRNKIKVTDSLFAYQNYGIALPENSPLREPVNRVMLKIIQSEQWGDVIDRYLGSQRSVK